MFCCIYVIIAIKHDFVIHLHSQCHSGRLKGFALGFQHFPWDLANVYEWKIMFDPSIDIGGAVALWYSVGLRSERSGVRSSLRSPCCILKQDRPTFTSQKVLVIPRKRWLRPNMTEKLFTGSLSIKTKPKPNYPLLIKPNCRMLAVFHLNFPFTC